MLVAVSLVCGAALAQKPPKPDVVIPLKPLGLPTDAYAPEYASHCNFSWLAYRELHWLDDGSVVVVFSNSPDCTKREVKPDGRLTLAAYDTSGALLHITKVPYDAGEANLTGGRSGVWIGPENSVIVEVPESGLSRTGEVMVFSGELNLIQTIATSHDNWTNDKVAFLGVAEGRDEVYFSKFNFVSSESRCLSYSGLPLVHTGTCYASPYGLPRMAVSASFPVPKDYQAAFAGNSRDRTRQGIFLTSDDALCESGIIPRIFCSTHGTLIVIDVATNHKLFEKRMRRSGHPELSPDGKHVALFDDYQLDIFSLP